MNSTSSKMKSLFGIALVALAVNIATPQKSAAGVILTAVSPYGSMLGNAGGFFMLGGLATVIDGDLNNNDKLENWGIFALVLDADSSLPKSEAIRYFSNHFTEVDNTEVAEAFAAKLNEKFKTLYAANPKAAAWNVSFTEAESMDLLAPAIDASITREQAEQIAAKLK
jgi:hypothetical protein